MAKKPNKPKALPIHILNGPNLNLLGSREPDIYGKTTLAGIEKACRARAEAHGFSILFDQSNKEGELVEMIQRARTASSAVIINAAAYTHTSVAVLDALKMLTVPAIEVHLSQSGAAGEFPPHLLCGDGRHRHHRRLRIEFLSSGHRCGGRTPQGQKA